MLTPASNQPNPAASPNALLPGQPDYPLSAASRRFQQQLVERYQSGQFSLAQLHKKLADAPFQILYRSQATTPPTAEQLQELVARARSANAAAQVTGLLLYSDGDFVQVLEGTQDTVRALYAKISQDPRHQQIAVISAGLLPARQFAEWSMDFGLADAAELEQVLAAISADHRRGEMEANNLPFQNLLDSFTSI